MSYDGFMGGAAEREMVGPDPSLFTRKIKVKQYSISIDPSTGGQQKSVGFESDIYAWVRQRRSREFYAENALQAELTAEVMVNYQSSFDELDSSWALEMDGAEWNVIGVEYPFGPKRYPLLQVSRTFKRAGA